MDWALKRLIIWGGLDNGRKRGFLRQQNKTHYSDLPGIFKLKKVLAITSTLLVIEPAKQSATRINVVPVP
jgi:hypothetical protein